MSADCNSFTPALARGADMARTGWSLRRFGSLESFPYWRSHPSFVRPLRGGDFFGKLDRLYSPYFLTYRFNARGPTSAP